MSVTPDPYAATVLEPAQERGVRHSNLQQPAGCKGLEAGQNGVGWGRSQCDPEKIVKPSGLIAEGRQASISFWMETEVRGRGVKQQPGWGESKEMWEPSPWVTSQEQPAITPGPLLVSPAWKREQHKGKPEQALGVEAG